MTPGDGKPMLSGVKVVDLTSVVFGPYATQTLADLGAEVIKVESPPAGDVFRWAGKPAATPGMGPGFMAINRGKQSVVLDLKNPDDLAVMMALLADADVFVSNVRGQGMERLGLDYDSVRRVRSDIIYVHCVGFGQDGPYADLPAYDDVIQAASARPACPSASTAAPRPASSRRSSRTRYRGCTAFMPCSQPSSTGCAQARGNWSKCRCWRRLRISSCSNIWAG